MKFISKSSNLLVVLRPGIPAQPITGTPPTPTLSVRFKDGMAEVAQEELIKYMMAHPGFGGDFISAEEVSSDPYAHLRQPTEPAHVLTDMKYGTPQARVVKGPAPKLPPEIQAMVNAMAADMAKKMLPSMVEETLKTLVSNNETIQRDQVQQQEKEDTTYEENEVVEETSFQVPEFITQDDTDTSVTTDTTEEETESKQGAKRGPKSKK